MIPLVFIFLVIASDAVRIKPKHSRVRTLSSDIKAAYWQVVNTSVASFNLQRKAVFCWGQARTPHDAILQPWIKQVSAACDDWAVFSWKDDPALGVVGAYPKSWEARAWRHQNEDVYMGAWKYFHDTGVARRYDWFLHLDIDTFVVPSRLRKAIAQYPSSSGHILTQGGESDGYFVAIPQQVMHNLWTSFLQKPECLGHVNFQALSGHNNLKDDEYEAAVHSGNCQSLREEISNHKQVMLADADGDVLVAAFNECTELQDADRLGTYASAPKERWCGRLDNTLLRCFEIAVDCSTEDVLAKECGRSLPDDVCVSSHFAALHPVKDAADFARLAKAFP